MNVVKNQCYGMFPQILGLYEYEKKEEFKKEVLKIIEYYKGSKEEYVENENGLTHYFNFADSNIFDNEVANLKPFYDFLMKSVNSYAEESLYSINECQGFVITDCWINIGKQNSYQQPHNHANSFFSGTYYVSFNPKYHSRLTFRNPHNFANSQQQPYFVLQKIDKYNSANNDFYVCDLYNEGDLLIWQSGLHHAYSPCLGSGDDEGETADDNGYHGRISISMNFVPKYLRQGPYSLTIQEKSLNWLDGK